MVSICRINFDGSPSCGGWCYHYICRMMDKQEYQSVWHHEHIIMWQDCLPNGMAGISALCNYFQEGAWLHAEHLGVGYEKLRESNQVWVMSRLYMHLDHYPGWGDTLKLRTWPTGVDKIFARRDFTFSGQLDNTFGIGASWWIVINPETRLPQPVEGVKDLTLAPRLEGIPEGRIKIPHNLVWTGRHQVEYIELDQHQHVNNTRYAAWIVNSFGKKWNTEYKIKTYYIEFLAEAFYLDEIEFFSYTDEKADSFFRGIRTQDQKEIFRAALTWEKIDNSRG